MPLSDFSSTLKYVRAHALCTVQRTDYHIFYHIWSIKRIKRDKHELH